MEEGEGRAKAEAKKAAGEGEDGTDRKIRRRRLREPQLKVAGDRAGDGLLCEAAWQGRQTRGQKT